MNLHARSFLVVPALALVLSTPAFAAMAEPPSAVSTYFRLLVGRPTTTPGETSILVVPGTVVVPGENAEQRATDILRVIDQLLDAYRLGTVEPAGSRLVTLQADETKDVPSVAGGPALKATLVAADEKSATYRIALSDGSKLLAEPVIRVQRGSRGIVGSRDGEAAPYLFLVVEPLPPPPGGSRSASPGTAGPVAEPKLVKKVNPVYPDAAKQAKLEGIVLLECAIDTSGRVKSAKAIRGEPMGLTEAAIAAVSQWEFEPARGADGRPVEVLFTVTIRFALQ
jgi:TonB family protein